jgi:hypothetical protein
VSEASPAARRLTRPSWLDTRVALGLLLLMTAVVVGARVFAAADRYTTVYVARHALVPGEQLHQADVTVGRVRFDGESGQYVATGALPAGYLVTRYVAPGELLPRAALTGGAAVVVASRLVTVPVAAGHLPVDLGRGDEVDVYLTSKKVAGGTGAPSLVLPAAVVDTVDSGGGLSADETSSVVLVVPADRVAAVVRAVESGDLDLVRVPPALLARAQPLGAP